jgi:hypothetical protein
MSTPGFGQETLRLLNEEIKTKVEAGAKILTMSQHKWRDIPDLIRRLMTAIPSDQESLLHQLHEYSNMASCIGPFVVKAGYTRDLPLQVMRQHIATIAKQYGIPIHNTRPWTIHILWHRHVVEIYHSIRYDANTKSCPYVCSSPCIDDV